MTRGWSMAREQVTLPSAEQLALSGAWVWLELSPEQKRQVQEALGRRGSRLFLHVAELVAHRYTAPRR